MQELQSLRSLFKDRIFKIPDYQRGYAWEKQQVIDLWEDIVNLGDDRKHYTGLISLRAVQPSERNTDGWLSERWLITERDYQPYYVVDGQQRLTTFVILLNELLNLIASHPDHRGRGQDQILVGSYPLREIREHYLGVKMPLTHINTYKFGYERDNPSFKYLKHKILGEEGGGTIDETYYTLNLGNAKKLLQDSLQAYMAEHGLKAMESVFRKLTQNLMFNVHEIEDDFDVFVAFETMNNRGKPLSHLELLKNRLIYLTTLYDDSILGADGRRMLRDDINSAWSEVYHQLGRNKDGRRLPDDDFLRAHWIIHFQYTRRRGQDAFRYLLGEKFSVKSLYGDKRYVDAIPDVQEVRDLVDEDEPDEENCQEAAESTPAPHAKQVKLPPSEIRAYVKSLESAAVHWYNTYYPKDNVELSPDERLWLERLNRIGIAYFRPLVVASFLNRSLTLADRVRLFKEIERFIFIAFRLGRASSTYHNSECFRLTKQLQTGEKSIDDVCRSLRSRIEGWLTPATGLHQGPFKDYLKRKFDAQKGYYAWSGLPYFLYEYELDIVLQRGNKKIDWDLFVRSDRDTVSIEHIYPQTTDNVPYWEKAFARFSPSQRIYLAGSLGNLLPLSQSKNASMQNDSFPDKKRAKRGHTGYRDGSHSEIEVADISRWNAQAILRRGVRLLEFMERRWEMKFKGEKEMKEILFLEFLK